MSLTSPASPSPRIHPALTALPILLLTLALLVAPSPVRADEPVVLQVRSIGSERLVPTGEDNDFLRLLKAFEQATEFAGPIQIELEGTFDWTESHAFISWCAGSDGEVGTADDWALTPPAGLSDIHVLAKPGFDAIILGPGEIRDADQETALRLSGGSFHNWTIEGLEVFGFEVSFRCDPDAVDPYPCDGLVLRNNRITVPADLSDVDEPNDPLGNVGVRLGPGSNQVIERNEFVLDGSGAMGSAAGGRGWVDGLRLVGDSPAAFQGLIVRANLFVFVGTPDADPQEVVAIRDVAGADASQILIANNAFLGKPGEIEPIATQWIGVEVGSHASAATSITYLQNRFSGLRYGMLWSGQEHPAPIPGEEPAAIEVTGNQFDFNLTGLWARSAAVDHWESLTLRYNTFQGNGLAVHGQQTHVALHANWWGCNEGPGAAGCDTVQVQLAESPTFDWTWLTLTARLLPDRLELGETAALVASLRVDSTGFDHGPIPLAIDQPVTFSARNPVTPESAPFDQGEATALLAATVAGVDRVVVAFGGTAVELLVPITQGGVLPVPALNVEPAPATAEDNDFTRIQNALAAAVDGLVVELAGEFDWTEPHAAASRAAGRDGVADSDDDYALEPAPAVGVTLRGSAAGAVVRGGGDLPQSEWDGFLRLPPAASGWTVEQLELLDFEIAILLDGCDENGCSSGLTVRDNRIRVAAEHEGGETPNVALYAGSDDGLQVLDNEIELVVGEQAVAENGSVSVAIWTGQGDETETVGPIVRGNTIRVTGTPATADPAAVYGLLEEAYRVGLAATIEDNTLIDETAGTLPSAGIWITSQSAPGEIYRISGNRISGFAVGIGNWEGWLEVPEALPIELTGNHLNGNGRGIHFSASSQPSTYRLRFNRIAGNTVGVEVEGVAAIDAALNWWGCNGGAGAPAVGCASTGDPVVGDAVTAPWLVLGLEPNPLEVGTFTSVPFAATVVRDSNGADTSALGNLADGTLIAFSATGGTVTPALSPTISGRAAGSFTAGSDLGDFGVWAVLDGQTFGGAVTVTPSAADLSVSLTTARRIHNDGDPFELDLVVTNAGPATAVATTLASSLPPAVVGATWTCVATGGATCAGAGNGAPADADLALPPGATATYRVIGTIDWDDYGTAQVAAVAVLSGSLVDPTPEDASAVLDLLLGGLFSDDFESGDSAAWDAVEPPTP